MLILGAFVTGTSFGALRQGTLCVRRTLLALAVLAISLTMGCGGSSDAPGSTSAAAGGSSDWSAESLGREAQRAPLTPMIVNSAPGVGLNRLAFGFIDKGGGLVTTVTDGRVRLFTLQGNAGTFVAEHALYKSSLSLQGSVHEHADGTQHLHDGPEAAMYTALVELTQPDFWGAELTWSIDGKTQRQRVRFFVRPDTPEPSIGESAPASVQKTLRDGIPLADLDTSREPQQALHEITIAEAVRGGKVAVIAFATPAFCQTRFCGPVVESVVVPAWRQFGDRINVLHVEPFDVPAARNGSLKPEPVTAEWGLQTEPWIFVLDRNGRVAAKFEGVVSLKELTDAIDAALKA